MRVIDLLHLGRERVIACWEVDGVLIDPGPTSCLPVLLEALGERRPRALLLTHIHLDHAGASGSLVRRWPDLDVYVHTLGAPHLADPRKLLQSARRLYGDDMDRLWGETLPVPEANLRILEGGEEIMGGAFKVAYTPGHASHHVSYLHDGTAFVGDVGGVRITPCSLTVPPTPPPDVDVEAWQESIELIRSWRPRRLAFTHFGSAEDVDAQLDEVSRRLVDWAARAHEQDMEAFIAGIEEEIAAGSEPGTPPAFAQAAPPKQLYMGLERYWRKRAEAIPPATGPSVS